MKLLFLLCLTFSMSAATAQMELPKPPAGFEWVEIFPKQAALFKPNGWHYETQKVPGTDAFFITKENIKRNKGRYETGLALNVFWDMKKRQGVLPSQYAANFIRLSSEDEDTRTLKTVDLGENHGLRGFIHLIEIHPKDDLATTIHRFFLANDQTGTLWFFFFEAPSSEWEAAWEKGSVILGQVLVETEL